MPEFPKISKEDVQNFVSENKTALTVVGGLLLALVGYNAGKSNGLTKKDLKLLLRGVQSTASESSFISGYEQGYNDAADSSGKKMPAINEKKMWDLAAKESLHPEVPRYEIEK